MHLKKFLYLLIMLSLVSLAEAQKLKKLGIQFESTTYSFGDVQMWENQPAIFSLKNNSKHAISILPLFSENDLEIIYPETSIQPGESAIIKAIFYTSGTGSFSRKFPIYFNTSPEAYDLKITGNIKSLSPTAYIQCPQAKPEHSKPKVELYGNVAELLTEIPLSGSTVKIVGVTNKSSVTFFADKNGNFGSKMPTGNYQVIVEHPNYEPHSSFFFLGQNSGHLKIRLSNNAPEPVLAQNTQPNPLPKQTNQNLDKKEAFLNNDSDRNSPKKVNAPEKPTTIPKPNIEQEDLSAKSGTLTNSNPKKTLDKVETFDVNETIPYPDYTEETKQPTPTITETVTEETPVVKVKTPTPVETTVRETTKPKTNTSQKKPVEVVAPPPPPRIHSYTVKVIDEKTLEPIEEAQLYINEILNKKNTQKLKSDAIGMASFNSEKLDYRVVVNADNYISGEAIIAKGQTDEIIRVFLSPVSDMFDEIYAAKKKEQNNDELLGQLSFNKTEFSFADREPEEEPELEKQAEPVVVETPIQAVQTIEEPTRVEEPVRIEEPVYDEEPTANIPSAREKENLALDSIQRLLADLQAEKQAMQEALVEKSNELDEKEDLLALKENEFSKKDLALGEKDYELAKVKNDFEASQDELDKQKEALLTLEKETAPLNNDSPEEYGLSVSDYAANNVLFLIDVSSSMGKENKMELLKESIKSLALVLRDIDRVAIIAYNQKTQVILESVPGNEKALILNAIDSLQTSGLTYGVNGLQTAYELLEYYHIGDGNNQIILATDGLFSSANATMSENSLNKEVRKKAADSQIKLSVIGFGQDKDGQKLMEKLADNGDGQFIQIKNPWEAKTVLIEEIKLNSKR